MTGGPAPLIGKGDSMEPKVPGTRKSPDMPLTPVGAATAEPSRSTCRKEAMTHPVFPSPHHIARARQGHIAPAMPVGHPKGTHEDDSWGSGSPLTNIIGTYGRCQECGGLSHLFTCLCAPHKTQLTGPYLRRWVTVERITQARQLESLILAHVSGTSSCSVELVCRISILVGVGVSDYG
jgi:hypothetical protein